MILRVRRKLFEITTKPSIDNDQTTRSIKGDPMVSRGSDTTVRERSNLKIFLRTHKIMVMHSNKREECDLRTLVDRQRKRLAQRG